MSQNNSLPAYATTTVTVGRSQDELREVLRAHDATSFHFGEAQGPNGLRYAGVEFTHGNLRVAMLVPIRVPTDEEADQIEKASHRKRGWLDPEPWAEARTWRIIAWTIRARLIAVEEGVETFEQAFLSHIINPATGRTVYNDLAEDGRVEVGQFTIPQLEAGA